ncbi:PIG-L deacetylase family protein [Salinarimonas sp.]|uniref:PIG-L deacetylase family protein n=1 Tax=Salinarimonas sp. TaxID=2766526 RepID=UPI0039195490
MSPLSLLFVGAHPDDIEIGAGDLARAACAAELDVHVAILTRERDPSSAARRSAEAKAALRHLGVAPDRILEAPFPDGDLRVTSSTVSYLRGALTALGCDPDVVVTHTRSDSHQDHRAAYDLVLSTFRGKTILGMPIRYSFLPSDFQPRLIRPVECEDAKAIAIDRHASQIACGRIRPDEVSRFDEELGEQIAPHLSRPVEAFDVTIQLGAPSLIATLTRLRGLLQPIGARASHGIGLAAPAGPDDQVQVLAAGGAAR